MIVEHDFKLQLYYKGRDLLRLECDQQSFGSFQDALQAAAGAIEEGSSESVMILDVSPLSVRSMPHAYFWRNRYGRWDEEQFIVDGGTSLIILSRLDVGSILAYDLPTQKVSTFIDGNELRTFYLASGSNSVFDAVQASFKHILPWVRLLGYDTKIYLEGLEVDEGEAKLYFAEEDFLSVARRPIQ